MASTSTGSTKVVLSTLDGEVVAVAPDTDWTRPDHVVVPDPATAPTYASLLRTFTELYPATRAQVHRLARSAL